MDQTEKFMSALMLDILTIESVGSNWLLQTSLKRLQLVILGLWLLYKHWSKYTHCEQGFAPCQDISLRFNLICNCRWLYTNESITIDATFNYVRTENRYWWVFNSYSLGLILQPPGWMSCCLKHKHLNPTNVLSFCVCTCSVFFSCALHWTKVSTKLQQLNGYVAWIIGISKGPT